MFIIIIPPLALSSCNHNCSDFLLLLACFILMHQKVCHVSLRWSGSCEPMEMKKDDMHPIPTFMFVDSICILGPDMICFC